MGTTTKSINTALTKKADRYKSARTATRAARVDLDAAVKDASEGGLSYRDIAREIGMSVAWVQLSLTRSGVVRAD